MLQYPSFRVEALEANTTTQTTTNEANLNINIFAAQQKKKGYRLTWHIGIFMTPHHHFMPKGMQ